MFVTPAQAGVQMIGSAPELDSRLRGNDGRKYFRACLKGMLMYRPLSLTPVLCLFLALPAQAADQRTVIRLSADEVASVQAEMRSMLAGVNQIVAGLAANDMQTVTKAARGQGVNGQDHVPMDLRMKMPEAFRSMGHPMHMAFDDLARDAESLGDANQALKQLGDIMNTCNACHQTFRLVVKK